MLPPIETYYLHFEENQSSLRAYTRSAHNDPPYKLLRSNGISPIESDVFMTNQNTAIDQKDIIDMHIELAQPTLPTTVVPGQTHTTYMRVGW